MDLSNYQIPHKSASDDMLQSWRKQALVLNATRRFRYTLNFKKKKLIEDQKKTFKIGAIATHAAMKFLHAGRATPCRVLELQQKASENGFGIDASALSSIVEGSKYEMLKHHGGVRGIAHSLKTSLKEGLDDGEAGVSVRQEVFGSNTYPEKPPKGFFVFVWEAMHDLTLIILAVCAVVSLGVGISTEGLAQGWYDGAGIAFSIILVVFVTAASDYQQSLQFRDLDKEKKKIFIQVTRAGCRLKVSIYDLVVGDVVHLSIGDQVPADGLFVSGYSLIVDESSMTGESDPVHKSSEKPFLLSGTKVQDGSGLMLVTGVGMNTEWGHLMATLGEECDSETPLQVKLNGLATFIGKLGLFFAVLTFIVLVGRFLYSKDSLTEWSGADFVAIVDYFAIAVTIIVVAVPEGLPLAVTLTLAYAMKKMMYDKALVRHLAACETMGSATTICSDKTGTLTTNKMTVTKVWVAGKIRDVDRAKSELGRDVIDRLCEGIYQNTSGDIAETEEGGNTKPIIIGTPTETAVLQFGCALGSHFKEVREKSEILKCEPFSSAKKKMGVVVKSSDGNVYAHWKGASEIVLGMCDQILDADGNIVPIDTNMAKELNQTISQFADQALRTLCLAYKCVEQHHHHHFFKHKNDASIPDKGFICMAIVGIKDPVRPGVPEAVRLCFSAGIKVRMVTGDNLHTAIAIARECGILTDGEAVQGPEFRNWSPEEMQRRIPNLQVMARSSPSDKHTLVRELKELGEVVAVTGDGTNDAPALKEADIGLAMGIAGTEVAKESADVVILDDNFRTIVVVGKWGRAVYTNIQKFVQFQLTVNLVALVVNFVSACITGSTPLTAVQLLWVNLIMDTLGALALATEPPHDDLMKKRSVGRNTNFISNIMWRNIFGQVVYQLTVLGILQYKGKDLLHLSGVDVDELLNTMIFNAFVFCQIFNEINAREMEKINVFAHTFDNWVFLLIIVFTVVFQVILVEFLGKFANTVPLNGHQWLLTVLIGFFGMIVAVLVKFVPVSSKPLSSDSAVERLRSVHSNGYQQVPGGPPGDV